MHHAPFVHLHLHTYYSLLDGAIPIDVLAAKAKELKMPAIAMTDHGNLFGAIEFYEKIQKAGIKPLIGCEVYLLTKGSRKDHVTKTDGFLSHLTLLCKNKVGYKNICRLVSSSHLEGFYYKPRIDKTILAEYNEGLIALSGCLKGEIPVAILSDNMGEAMRVAKELAGIFTDNRLFLELQEQGLDGQKKICEGLKVIAREAGLPLVATNDVHFLRKEDAKAQDALLCIQTGTTIDAKDRLRFDSDEFYLKSADEMKALFSDCPEAIENTIAIAERLNLEFDFKTYHFPKFTPPEGKDLTGFLEELARKGLDERWELITSLRGKDSETLRAEYEKRLAEEIALIKSMGFSGYFLIVADFIGFAKSVDIPVGPGRGSAAGSLVAYCLKITDIDPILHGLFFERFLNPERISMPDMDIDFCMRRREEVIRYVTEKYGNVSQIITFGKMKARAAVRDVGRVMGMAYGEVDRIAKLIPATLNVTLEQALKIEPKLTEAAKANPQIKQMLDIAMSIEGFPRHASTHAAGVVMSDQPLTEFLPLYLGQHDEVVTQFDMKAVEKIGLIKFDFLGLRTLTVIDDTIKLIEKCHNTKLKIDALPFNDPVVYKGLSEGDTAGVFQLESSGMTDLVMRLKPTVFADLVALVALFRPGPLGSGMVDDFIDRKHGKRKIAYELPQLEAILKDTYGVIVYQEQVMQIANRLAGFTLGEADILRRAMGKKKPEEMQMQKERFVSGCVSRKIPKIKAEKLFELIAQFAEYGFNKCVVRETELVDANTGKIFTVADLIKDGPRRKTFSCDGRKQIVPGKIVSVTANGRKEVFSLKTHLGHQIVATNNHPFLTIGGWKKMGELKIGERIAVPRIIPVKGKKRWHIYKLISLAWLLSEGNTCHPNSLYFYNNDTILIKDFVKHIECFPDTKARVYKRRKNRIEVCVNTGFKSRYPSRRSGAFIWAHELGLIGKKANNKEISSEVFSLTNSQLALFLGRLWSGDGFIFDAINSVPFYATSSPKMVKQIQILLLRFGIISRMATKKFKYKKSVKMGYALYLTGDDSVKKFAKHIVPHIVGRSHIVKSLLSYLKSIPEKQASRDTIPWEVKWLVRKEKELSGKTWVEIEKETDLSMKEFCGGCHPVKRGFRRDTILQLGKYFHSDKLVDLGQSDIYWDEVKNISSKGMQETFDLTMERNHNFVANGIIVHNSHSAAYALLAYQTAHLKFHYQTEFMAALLTSEKDNTDKVLTYFGDCRGHDIKVLPPDVNESEQNFSVIENNIIRFGLGAVKNVGEAAIENIIMARKEKGAFKSIFDFCERVDSRKVNKRVIESLIKCGAFDFTKAPRAAMFASLDVAMELAFSHQRDRQSGQTGLFDMLPEISSTPKLADVHEWPERQLLANEKEAIGFYITGHPLVQFESILKQYTTVDTSTLINANDKQEVRIGGVGAKLREITTKRGDRMGFVTLEDLKGSVDVVVFSDLYATSHLLIKEGDKPLFVIGQADTDGENAKIIASQIFPLEEAAERLTKSIHFFLHEPETTPNHIAQLKNVLTRFPGGCPAFLHFIVPEKTETVLSLPSELKLAPSPQLVVAVDRLFGHNVTRFSL